MKQTDNIPAGYKSSPLGIIPMEWEVKKLAYSFKLQGGYAFKSELFKDNGNIPIVRISDLPIDKNYVNISKCVYYPEIVLPQQFIVKKGDLLIAMSGATTGKSAIYFDTKNAYLNQRVGLFKQINGDIDYKYLIVIVNSDLFFNELKPLLIAGAQPNISPSDIEDMCFPIPPLPEQRKIAEILSVWDSAIEKQTALIEKLETRKRALMQQLLTGKKRLKGFSGDNDLKKLKPYITELSERNNDKKVTTVLSVTNANGFISQSEQFGRSVASEDITNYKIVRKGQFAFNPSRVNVGSLDLLRTFDAGILSPMYIVFTTDITALDAMFLYYQLKSGWFLKHIPMYVQGSVRDSLTFDALCAMKFFIPTLPEQTAIAEILTTADNEIALAKQKLDSIRQQKKGLMQVLLTGKKRVKI